MIQKTNQVVYAGKTSILEFNIIDDNAQPIDLTSVVSSTFQVINDIPEENSAAIITKSLTVSDAARGLVTVTLDNTETDIDVGRYTFNLIFNFDTDDDRILGVGQLIVKGDDTNRLAQIKTLYGLSFDDYILNEALTYSHTEMIKNAFYSQKIENVKTDNNNMIAIANYVMDSDLDGTVDKTDITIYEYTTTPPLVKTDLADNISSVTFDYPDGKTHITMDDSYPSANNRLVVEYKQGSSKYDDLRSDIRKLEETYVLYYLFSVLEPYKLQQGMTEKTLNGVTLRYDKDSIDKLKRDLFSRIKTYQFKIQPLKLNSVLINKGY